MHRWLPMYGLTQLLVACTANPRANSAAVTGDPSRPVTPSQTVPLTVISPTRATSLRELFAEAEGLAKEGQFAEAAEQFRRLAALEPSGPWAATALFRAGLAYDAEEMWPASADAFDEAANTASEQELSREARLRATRVRLHLGQWRQAGQGGESILSVAGNPSTAARIVARTGLSLGALDAGQLADAEYHVSKGLSLVETLGLDRGGGLAKDVAVLYFALGEARRVAAGKAMLDGRPEQFAQSLESRCARLLEAQSAYSDAMRGRDAHWSTLAGLRVGQLYADLHRELTAIPPPREVNASEQMLFEAAMRYRYSVLLDKAVTMVEHTVSLAERTKVAGPWKKRAVEVLQELRQARERERAVIQALPITEAQLKQALEQMADKRTEAP